MVSLSALNPPQYRAVTTTEGPLLVLAGAGSGKTRVITYRVAHLLDKGHKPDSILAVSFTNKAADEMRERVDRLCTGGTARRVMLCTFHALGLSILKQEQTALGMPNGFSVYDTSDQLGVLREILRFAHMEGRKLDVKAIQSRISRAKNAGLSAQDFLRKVRAARFVSEYDGYTAEIFPRYVEKMRALHAFDFDDLLVESLRLLRQEERVRKRWQTRFRFLMIDEYQDTNACQLELLRILCETHRNLAVVGDDDQSIYAWRGADSRNILDFEKQFPGAQVIKLEENYRSTGKILRTANAVIGKNQARHTKTLWTKRGEGNSLQHVVAPDEHAEADFVASEIDALVVSGKFELRDIAVLFRTSRQLEPLEQSLRQARIDYRVIGGQAFFDRKEVKDAMSYMKMLAYPHDELSLRRVINYPPRGIGIQSMDALSTLHKDAQKHNHDVSLWEVLRNLCSSKRESLDLFEEDSQTPLHDSLSPRVMKALSSFVGTLVKHQRKMQETPSDGLLALGEELLREMGMQDDLIRSCLNMRQAERRLRNLRDFLSGMQRYAEKAGPDFDLLAYLNKLSLSSQEEDMDDALRDEVTLSTLHGAKGLEWKVVFLVGMEEEILPHKRALYPREGDQTLAGQRAERTFGAGNASGEETNEETAASDISEERRLCYVGITRARQKLYVCRAESRNGWPRIASRFLDDMPDDCVVLRNPEEAPPDQKPDDEVALVRLCIEQSLKVSGEPSDRVSSGSGLTGKRATR